MAFLKNPKPSKSHVKMVKVGDILLDKFLPEAGMGADDLKQLREVLKSHAVVREFLTPYPDEKDRKGDCHAHLFYTGSDGTRQRRHKSYELALQLVEQTMYGTEMDTNFSTGIKHCKSSHDIVEYVQFQEDLQSVKNNIEHEKQAKRVELGLPAVEDSAPAVETSSSASPDDKHKLKAPHYKQMMDKLNKASDQEANALQNAAQNLSRQWAKIVPWSDSEKEMIEMISGSEIGSAKGTKSGVTLIHYNQEMAGEAACQPAIRGCPFQLKAYNRFVRIVLTGRSLREDGEPTLKPGVGM
jgi:hypothetical protein